MQIKKKKDLTTVNTTFIVYRDIPSCSFSDMCRRFEKPAAYTFRVENKESMFLWNLDTYQIKLHGIVSQKTVILKIWISQVYWSDIRVHACFEQNN
jgi:hypothetical protein